jgi:hypothetical protein
MGEKRLQGLGRKTGKRPLRREISTGIRLENWKETTSKRNVYSDYAGKLERDHFKEKCLQGLGLKTGKRPLQREMSTGIRLENWKETTSENLEQIQGEYQIAS